MFCTGLPLCTRVSSYPPSTVADSLLLSEGFCLWLFTSKQGAPISRRNKGVTVILNFPLKRHREECNTGKEVLETETALVFEAQGVWGFVNKSLVSSGDSRQQWDSKWVSSKGTLVPVGWLNSSPAQIFRGSAWHFSFCCVAGLGSQFVSWFLWDPEKLFLHKSGEVQTRHTMKSLTWSHASDAHYLGWTVAGSPKARSRKNEPLPIVTGRVSKNV